MRQFYWDGTLPNRNPWATSSNGTGQSGGVALDTTASRLLNGQVSCKMTSQTSSGNGTIGTSARVMQQTDWRYVRYFERFQIGTDSSSWANSGHALYIWTGAQYASLQLEIYSNDDSGSLIRVWDSTSAWVDTGLTWTAWNAGNRDAWFELEMVYDITADEYKMIRLSDDVVTTAFKLDWSANLAQPQFRIDSYITCATSAVSKHVDEQYVETWT